MTRDEHLTSTEIAWRGAVDSALAALHSVAAHELRSPLNAMRLNLSLVRRTMAGGTAERWLTVVEEESRRLEKLLEAYLKMSSGAEHGHGAPVESEDLGELLRAGEPLLRSLASKRGVELAVEAASVPGHWPAGTRRVLFATLGMVLAGAPESDQLAVGLEAREPGGVLLRLSTRNLPSREQVEALWHPLGAGISIDTTEATHTMVIQLGASK